MTQTQQRDVSPPKSRGSSKDRSGTDQSRKHSSIRMYGTTTELANLKQQSTHDNLEGLNTHHSSKQSFQTQPQNVFGSTSGFSNQAKQRQTSHFGVIEEEETSYNNSEAQSKKLMMNGLHDKLPEKVTEEQNTPVRAD